jgi:hypothetical protein
MSEEIANHSDDIQQDTETEAVYESFGVTPTVKSEEIEFPSMDEPDEEPEGESDPTTEPEQPKGIKVKYNGEEKLVSEEEAPTLLQKGLNYDKVQQRLQEQQTALDRVARLQGYNNHAELVANLDKIESEQRLAKERQFAELEQRMLDQLLASGVDEDVARDYVNNNPVVQENRRFKQQLEQEQQIKQKEAEDRAGAMRWSEFFSAFPQLENEWNEAHAKGETAKWITDEFGDYIVKGYHPTDAYKLANMSSIQAQQKKQTEQKIIKQQQLGARAKVESNGVSEIENDAISPVQVALAEMYGVSPDSVRKQQKIIQSRR